MERSSSDAWYNSFRKMMEDLIYNQTPFTNSLRPYLSRTYATIGSYFIFPAYSTSAIQCCY